MIGSASSDLTKAIHKVWVILTGAQRRASIMLLGLMLIGVALEALSIGLIVPALAMMTDTGASHRYPLVAMALEAFGSPDGKWLMIAFALLVFGAYLIKNIFFAVLLWRQNVFVFAVISDLSLRLFATYLRQPYEFHLQRNSASLVQNVTHEADILGLNVIAPAMVILTEIVVLAGLTTMVFVIEPVGAAVAALLIATSAYLFGRLVFPRNSRLGSQRQHHIGHMVRHLQQGLGAVKDVKLLGREAEFLQQYRVHCEQNAQVGSSQSVLVGLPRLWLEVLAVGGLVALIVSMILQSKSLATIVPVVGLFAAAAFRLMPSVSRIVSAGQSLKFGMPAIERIHGELNLPPCEDGSVPSGTFSFRHELTLDHVSFRYVSSAYPSVQDVSLVIPKGACVGLVGATGSGKSTLVDLVLGLLKPGTGSVKVDGVDIQGCLRNWQNMIGYVPQSIYLTDDSLRRNIAFGLPIAGIDEAAVWRAIRAAQLESIVESLPQGLDTMVGERGVRLSGGQRQRIGIARALYHDPPFLVLDEATNALDPETENAVMETIRAFHGEKTMIIVAHRPGTIGDCDLVIRLDQGKIQSSAARRPSMTTGARV